MPVDLGREVETVRDPAGAVLLEVLESDDCGLDDHVNVLPDRHDAWSRLVQDCHGG